MSVPRNTGTDQPSQNHQQHHQSDSQPQPSISPNKRNNRNVFQRRQRMQRLQLHRKNLCCFQTPAFKISVVDLLIAILYCYLTYFLLCIFQKFVNFLSNEYYFIMFLITLFGFMLMSNKKNIFSITKKNE
jgi:hypothetical protein